VTKPSDKKNPKIGPLEQLMLLSIIQLGDNAYGVTIQKTIEAVNQKPLAASLLYTTLSRLVEKGALIDRLGPSSPVQGGKAKRFYCITPTGKIALKQAELEEHARAAARQNIGLLSDPLS